VEEVGSMGHWWKDIDRVKPKNSERNFHKYHLIHRKYHMGWPGFESRPLQREPCKLSPLYGSVVEASCLGKSCISGFISASYNCYAWNN